MLINGIISLPMLAMANVNLANDSCEHFKHGPVSYVQNYVCTIYNN